MNMQNVQNVKDSHFRQTVDWDNISFNSENEEGDRPNEITNNTTNTTVECSSEIKCSTHQVIFTEGMTEFMLEKYGKFMNFVGPMKKF